MIPRVVHYCWFGGNPYPPKIVRCMKSWKKYLPDYEFKLWNEQNFDVDALPYTREAYRAKKWAFVSDVARLHALVTCGGIYLDTDVEIRKPMDDLLHLRAFTGIEAGGMLEMEVLGAEPGFPLFREMLESYLDRRLILADGSMDMRTITQAEEPVYRRHGFRPEKGMQVLDGLTCFPREYFAPKGFYAGRMKITKDTYAIHRFTLSWQDREALARDNLRRRFCGVLGERLGLWVYRRVRFVLRAFRSIRKKGLARALRERRAWREEHPG